MIANTTWILIVVTTFTVMGTVAVMLGNFHKAKQGEALVRSGIGEPKVAFTGMMALPAIHQLEKLDMTAKAFSVVKKGDDGLLTKDGERAGVNATFLVRVAQKPEAVMRVARSIGCQNAANPKAVKAMLAPKATRALKAVAKQFDFNRIATSAKVFEQQVVRHMKEAGLAGYVIEDCVVDCDQKPLKTFKKDFQGGWLGKNRKQVINTPLGKVCTILMPTDTNTSGQAKIEVKGTAIKFKTRCCQGTLLQAGDNALVVDYDKATQHYLVAPYNT